MSINELSDFSAKVKNLKCFGEADQGFDAIKPMNLIIGRNNSGKSTLLDLVAALTINTEFRKGQWCAGKRPEIVLKSPLTAEEVSQVFRTNASRGGIPSADHWNYGKQYVGSLFTWNLADIKQNPFENLVFKRILSERDISPEIDQSGDLNVLGNGQGTTNIIQNYINESTLPSNLVESVLLSDLNEIFSSDAHFTDIVCQKITKSLWEIYLEEKDKGRIPLSQSGSGLKTIILVLVFLYLVPKVEEKLLKDYFFGFEELENNLHPALLRRLLNYLYKKSKEHGCIFFLTTHSNVAIDQFSKNKDAQIIHVMHDGKTARAKTVKTYIENKGVLDDLDVRASDLLQSNGIIWLEGPSDRIYFNRWIELWTDGELQEGTHYQCVIYGGRLLSHLSADEPDAMPEAILIFNVNRNAVVMIDSDRREEGLELNPTKGRIIDELEKQNGTVWVTQGREIENYIPANALGSLIDSNSSPQVKQYESFFEYLDQLKPGQGTKYKKKKPILAEKICPHLNRKNLENVLDLAKHLDQVCQAIRKWNA